MAKQPTKKLYILNTDSPQQVKKKVKGFSIGLSLDKETRSIFEALTKTIEALQKDIEQLKEHEIKQDTQILEKQKKQDKTTTQTITEEFKEEKSPKVETKVEDNDLFTKIEDVSEFFKGISLFFTKPKEWKKKYKVKEDNEFKQDLMQLVKEVQKTLGLEETEEETSAEKEHIESSEKETSVQKENVCEISLNLLGKKIEQLSESITMQLTVVQKSMTQFNKSFMSYVSRSMKLLKTGFSSVASSIKNTITPLVKEFKKWSSWIQTGLLIVGFLLLMFWEKLSSKFQGIWQDLKQIFNSLWELLKSIGSFILDIFKELIHTLSLLLKPIVQIIKDVIAILTPLIKFIFKLLNVILVPIFQNVATILHTLFITFKNLFKGDFKGAFNSLKEGFLKIVKTTFSMFKNVYKIFKPLFTGLLKVFKGIFIELPKILIQKITDLFKKLWDWKKIKGLVSSWLSKLNPFRRKKSSDSEEKDVQKSIEENALQLLNTEMIHNIIVKSKNIISTMVQSFVDTVSQFGKILSSLFQKGKEILFLFKDILVDKISNLVGKVFGATYGVRLKNILSDKKVTTKNIQDTLMQKQIITKQQEINKIDKDKAQEAINKYIEELNEYKEINTKILMILVALEKKEMGTLTDKEKEMFTTYLEEVSNYLVENLNIEVEEQSTTKQNTYQSTNVTNIYNNQQQKRKKESSVSKQTPTQTEEKSPNMPKDVTKQGVLTSPVS